MSNSKIQISVQPGARRTQLSGMGEDGVVRIAVKGPAQEGRANEAVVALLAERLGVPRSCVQVAQGAASRRKRIDVEGLGQDELERRLAAALAKENAR